MEISHAADRLDAAAADAGEVVFLRGRQPVTFGEVAQASQAVAARLRGLGVTPGDRMLIVTRNHPEAIAAAFGAARCGVTFVFLHHTISAAGFARIVREVEPSCVVLDESTLLLRPAVGGLPLLTAGVSTQDGERLADVFAARGACRRDNERRDPLCLVYTSGSTGAPRGVMVSHANMAFTSAAIQRRLKYRADDVIGLYLPLSFDYGLYQLFLALDVRASVYLGSLDLVPLQLCESLAAEGATVLPAVPALVSWLVRLLDRKPRSLPRLRSVTNTGEPLPASLVNALRARLPEVEVFLMYGLTECKRVSILLPSELESHPGSVGRPLDGTTAIVVDAEGRPVPDDTPGELVVAGPHVTYGYWRAPEETARRFRIAADGSRAVLTGDTCRRSPDGYLYVEGRKDALVKHRGFRVSLLEIESAAAAASGAQCAAVIAPPHSDQLHLFLTRGAATSADAIARALRSSLEPHKVPDHIHVVTALPTTAHGKVDRDSLRLLAERQPR